MKATAFALLGGCLMLSSPALGQGLSDRIEHVMQQRSQTQTQGASMSHMLSVLMYTDVTVQFQETPAREAINYLQTLLGIHIVGRYSDDKIGYGIDPETPITLDVVQQPALTVLELMLDQCEEFDPCTWQLREGFVEVGTKERLSLPAARQIKYYPIRDLLFEPPMFDNAPDLDLSSALNQAGSYGGGGGGGGGRGGGGGGIFGDPDEAPDRLTEAERAQQLIDLITESVEPEAWDVNGGDWATIRYYSGTLIVRAPDYVHRQIGGYPFVTRPVASSRSASAPRRFLTFTGDATDVAIVGGDEAKSGGDAHGS